MVAGLAVGAATRADAAETLFARDGEGRTIASAFLDALLACPVDTRPVVVQNVVLAGGTTMLAGFQERFEAEVAALAAKPGGEYSKLQGVLRKISFTSPGFPRNCVSWAGASALAATEGNAKHFMTAEEYQKDGIPDAFSLAGSGDAAPALAPATSATPALAGARRLGLT